MLIEMVLVVDGSRLCRRQSKKIEAYNRMVGDYVHGYTPPWCRIGLVVIAAYLFALGYASR